MDWVFKASSSWDLTELDGDDFDAQDDTSVMGQNQNMHVFSVDPGFGTLEGTTMNKWNEQKYLTTSLSPSGPAKKPRGLTTDQHLSCLVDGCTADLSSCRDYHRRHRVCESHSKTPVVTIGGKERRFCQQCSRFHSLGEFDEVKRSCRKRLDGHNRRRRKPRAESMCLNYGSFLTNHRGTKLLHFGGSPAYATAFGSPLTWPIEGKFHQQLHVTVQQSMPSNSNSYARICSAREKKFPFLLGTDSDEVNHAIPEVSYSQQVVNTNASSHLLGKFSERLTQLVEPKGAHSLLSKHTIHTSGSSRSNMVRPRGTTLQFNDPLIQHPDPHLPLRNVIIPNGGGTNNHLIGMIHFRPEGMLENEASQLVSFSWN